MFIGHSALALKKYPLFINLLSKKNQSKIYDTVFTFLLSLQTVIR